ncbi:TenA family protein [Brevibacterium epidermidis]|jgi:thiaminase/transcriptional activator TenA|uniref:TenA family protein n=1 Tax=Brevibacterium epidermidis TaxID=1698 RepID=UPI000BF46823|nr:TenA family protein [Brevibacterium epidermidis]
MGIRQSRPGPAEPEAVDHRFVRELFAGSIDDTVMRDYLVQDYQFFESFLSMLGACAAHADELDAKLRFARQLGMLIVLVVAEWLYLDWAESREDMPPRQVHRGWIDLHRGEAFHGWVQFLVDELERVFPEEEDQSSEAETLTYVWQRAVDLECAFFDDVYDN